FLPKSKSPPPKSAGNPYRRLPKYQFWKQSVAEVEPDALDPIVSPRFAVKPGMKVATAGSCFAQHISRSLRANGFTYFTTEDTPETAIFSARYGNLYTARQLRQLWDRAFGKFSPVDSAWQRSNGSWVDPFRPEIKRDGFSSPEEVQKDRESHLNS